MKKIILCTVVLLCGTLAWSGEIKPSGSGGGITNPLSADLQGAGYNVTNVKNVDLTGEITASSVTAREMTISQTSNVNAITLNNAGTQAGLRLNQNAVLASARHSLHLYSGQDNVNSDSALAYFQQSGAGSTQDVLTLNQAGTGNILSLIGNDGLTKGMFDKIGNLSLVNSITASSETITGNLTTQGQIYTTDISSPNGNLNVPSNFSVFGATIATVNGEVFIGSAPVNLASKKGALLNLINPLAGNSCMINLENTNSTGLSAFKIGYVSQGTGLSFTTGGRTCMYMATANTFTICGIGTATPKATLHVVPSVQTRATDNVVDISSQDATTKLWKLDGNGNESSLGSHEDFGEVYVVSGSSQSDFLVQNVWNKITVLDQIGNQRNVVGSVAGGTWDLQATNAGIYQVNASLSFSGSASSTFEIGVSTTAGATISNRARIIRKLGTGGDVGSACISALIHVTAGTRFELWGRCTDASSKSITIQDANFNITRK